MFQLDNFLVCLDGTSHDEHLLKFCVMIAEGINCKKLQFVHVNCENQKNESKEELEKKVKKYFDGTYNPEIVILAGKRACQTIFRWKAIQDVDLIILGVKSGSGVKGSNVQNILNHSLCSVLLIPETNRIKLEKVLIPVDFSQGSYNAVHAAMEIKKRKDIKVHLQHVYFVPSGYSTSGKSYDEFSKIVLDNKKREHASFRRKYDLDESQYEMVYTLDEDQHPSDNIYDLAEVKGSDMIILSSRGRSVLASYIAKSTASNLVKFEKDIPILVVKNKKEYVGFFQALLKI